MGRIIHLLLVPMGDLAFWNVRGLNASVRQYDVKQFIAKNKVKIMCLLETQVKQVNKEKVLKRVSSWQCEDKYAQAPNGCWDICPSVNQNDINS